MRPFSAQDLRRLAGETFFERGRGYRNSVLDVRRIRGGVAGTVIGSENYTVRLTHDGTELSGACDCPVGEDGLFCKHCVGLGLALLHGESAAAEEPFDDTLLSDDEEQDTRLRAHLATLDRDTLTELLWEHAAEAPELYEKLRLHAASASASKRRPRRGRRGSGV